MMQYVKSIGTSATARIPTPTLFRSEQPVLDEEDEAFLHRITSEDDPPPLPARPGSSSETVITEGSAQKVKDAQIALMDGADKIPLPETPAQEDQGKDLVVEPEEQETAVTEDKGKEKATDGPKTNKWSWLRRDSRTKRTAQTATATTLDDVAASLKSPDAKPNEDGIVPSPEAQKEEEEMSLALERLNLAAVNNRVFSISKESQDLMQKFNTILKDLVNGVPTAYDDLESLLTNGDKQLQRTFSSLPGFLQKLIEQLPEYMTKGLAPEMLAAAAERANIKSESAGKAAKFMSKGLKVPSLKDLIGKPGAVAGTLRTIMNTLRARFPAFMGMNVLWSLAVFGE